ncbi:single-stranded-DNA-specific exonuclease RecJ [Candidatus Galacturonibacter soehngenii]|uniref:Single-stranded-DNA-specific exonuclease RecJ n=1 Tax=Candidatus Galacturonatibacter soehngenii TaxID=2307010 RepID=A0A7V7UD46_9FIRM|nr:single-stranded-DNA-specific exonuclease RecJ [Candidatus Galacturonibacter soehngenii]KAB1440445.1 single-stranded-DNA-specific exonuclease RecJ [Candidatus Galacturonibacter soehngenii]
MEKWFIQTKKADFHQLGKKYGIDPVIARIIRNRDIVHEDEIDMFLNGTLNNLHSPWLMKDMEKAVKIISEKIEQNKKIRVIGDYDIDGVNATYILLKGLSRCGAIVDTDIPDRMKDGYGINESLIDSAIEAQIDLIITCDNGIAAINQIAYAKQKGITVIITDHHDIPYEEIEGIRKEIYPMADAIINPKQSECHYPFDRICGAVVALKLVQALFEVYQIPEKEWHPLIENAAMATVGDVMDLVNENRIIVKEGLKRISKTSNKGLSSLLSLNGLEGDISSYHIGFVIGPCINAGGRLDTAKRALELLSSESIEEAGRLAGDLKSLNDSRKELTLKGLEEALHIIETTNLKNDKVLIVYLPDCHESLAGIIAGRIRENYNKPVIVFTDAHECAKGSGRSIEAYNMFEELSKFKDLFLKFGGHPMAAGLSLPKENIDLLREKLNQETTLTKEDFVAKILIDVPMPIHYITEQLVKQLEILEPFGKANEKPTFAEKNLKIITARILGKNQNVLKLLIQNEVGCKMDAMFFGNIEQFNSFLTLKYGEAELNKMYAGKENQIRLSITYYPSINEYNGNKSIQVIIKNYN